MIKLGNVTTPSTFQNAEDNYIKIIVFLLFCMSVKRGFLLLNKNKHKCLKTMFQENTETWEGGM